MGMFDRINGVPDMPCPDCGVVISGHQDWQSKDGPCDLLRYSFRRADNFYTNCPRCDAWIEFVVRRGAPHRGRRELKHYRDRVREPLASPADSTCDNESCIIETHNYCPHCGEPT